MSLSVALFDIDKTIYNDHSFFGVTKYFVDEGVLPLYILDGVNEETKKYFQKKQNYAATAKNLLGIYGKGLTGLSYKKILVKTKEFFLKNSDRFYPYFKEILPLLKEKYDIYLVTTNSQMVGEAVKEIFDLKGYLSTVFEVKDGLFTGKVLSTLAGGKHVVEELLSKYSGNSIAVGDSENDISMLEKVTIPVCINPEEELLLEAKERKWLIITDKNAKLEFQKILEGK